MNAIDELVSLAQWVRQGEYNLDDARDEIARAIENRIRTLETESHSDSVADKYLEMEWDEIPEHIQNRIIRIDARGSARIDDHLYEVD